MLPCYLFSADWMFRFNSKVRTPTNHIGSSEIPFDGLIHVLQDFGTLEQGYDFQASSDFRKALLYRGGH